MNGTKRAETMATRDAFIARIVAAVTELGETMTLVTKPQKGRPLTHFQTADGLLVKFDLLQPNGATGMWQIIAHHGYNKSYGRLDLVDVKPIAEILVKPIVDKRTEAASMVVATKLNAEIPIDSTLRFRAGHRGGLYVELRETVTEAQARALVVAARGCGLLPPLSNAQRADAEPVTRPLDDPYRWSAVPHAAAAGEAAFAAAKAKGIPACDAALLARQAAVSAMIASNDARLAASTVESMVDACERSAQ
jgi:hypothetical protein